MREASSVVLDIMYGEGPDRPQEIFTHIRDVWVERTSNTREQCWEDIVIAAAEILKND